MENNLIKIRAKNIFAPNLLTFFFHVSDDSKEIYNRKKNLEEKNVEKKLC